MEGNYEEALDHLKKTLITFKDIRFPFINNKSIFSNPEPSSHTVLEGFLKNFFWKDAIPHSEMSLNDLRNLHCLDPTSKEKRLEIVRLAEKLNAIFEVAIQDGTRQPTLKPPTKRFIPGPRQLVGTEFGYSLQVSAPLSLGSSHDDDNLFLPDEQEVIFADLKLTIPVSFPDIKAVVVEIPRDQMSAISDLIHLETQIKEMTGEKPVVMRLETDPSTPVFHPTQPVIILSLKELSEREIGILSHQLHISPVSFRPPLETEKLKFAQQYGLAKIVMAEEQRPPSPQNAQSDCLPAFFLDQLLSSFEMQLGSQPKLLGGFSEKPEERWSCLCFIDLFTLSYILRESVTQFKVLKKVLKIFPRLAFHLVQLPSGRLSPETDDECTPKSFFWEHWKPISFAENDRTFSLFIVPSSVGINGLSVSKIEVSGLTCIEVDNNCILFSGADHDLPSFDLFAEYVSFRLEYLILEKSGDSHPKGETKFIESFSLPSDDGLLKFRSLKDKTSALCFQPLFVNSKFERFFVILQDGTKDEIRQQFVPTALLVEPFRDFQESRLPFDCDVFRCFCAKNDFPSFEKHFHLLPFTYGTREVIVRKEYLLSRLHSIFLSHHETLIKRSEDKYSIDIDRPSLKHGFLVLSKRNMEPVDSDLKKAIVDDLLSQMQLVARKIDSPINVDALNYFECERRLGGSHDDASSLIIFQSKVSGKMCRVFLIGKSDQSPPAQIDLYHQRIEEINRLLLHPTFNDARKLQNLNLDQVFVLYHTVVLPISQKRFRIIGINGEQVKATIDLLGNLQGDTIPSELCYVPSAQTRISFKLSKLVATLLSKAAIQKVLQSLFHGFFVFQLGESQIDLFSSVAASSSSSPSGEDMSSTVNRFSHDFFGAREQSEKRLQSFFRFLDDSLIVSVLDYHDEKITPYVESSAGKQFLTHNRLCFFFKQKGKHNLVLIGQKDHVPLVRKLCKSVLGRLKMIRIFLTAEEGNNVRNLPIFGSLFIREKGKTEIFGPKESLFHVTAALNRPHREELSELLKGEICGEVDLTTILIGQKILQSKEKFNEELKKETGGQCLMHFNDPTFPSKIWLITSEEKELEKAKHVLQSWVQAWRANMAVQSLSLSLEEFFDPVFFYDFHLHKSLFHYLESSSTICRVVIESHGPTQQIQIRRVDLLTKILQKLESERSLSRVDPPEDPKEQLFGFVSWIFEKDTHLFLEEIRLIDQRCKQRVIIEFTTLHSDGVSANHPYWYHLNTSIGCEKPGT